MDSQRLAAARAAIPEFPYQPLDESQNEIRVLSLLPPDTQPSPSSVPIEDKEQLRSHKLVYCTIEHVSLDALAPRYEIFTSQLEQRPLSRRNTDESWRSFSNDKHHGGLPDGSRTPLARHPSHPRYHRFAWGDYGALSYTWGDQSDKVPIMLNDHVVKVGRNLEAALRALSTDPDYTDGLRLWVDAICINQHDLIERNHQVKRMGEIFGRALLVTIWLGTVPPGSVEGVKLIHDQITQCVDNETASAVVHKLFSNDEPSKRRSAVDAVDVLAHAVYWSRVWIIQEGCLGPFNPSILFGTFRFSLIPLQRFLQRATNTRGAVRAREKVWRILKLIELNTANQERSSHATLTSPGELAQRRRTDANDLALLLMLGRLAGSVDLRDKLYGLLCMIPEYVTRHIEPDYSKPVAQVFCEFARALVKGFDSFDLILTGMSGTQLSPKLPSWVPDLTDTWDPYLWGTDCQASEESSPQYRFEDYELIAKGFQVDVIDGTAPYLGWSNGILDIWEPAVQPTATVPPLAENEVKKAIVRTLYRDATYDTTTGTTLLDIPWFTSLSPTANDPRVQIMRERGWDPVLRHANLADFHQLRGQLNSAFRPWGREFRSFFPDSDDVSECKNPNGFIRALDKHCGIVYPVFTTEKGRFGAAIRPVRKGDVVLVVLGTSALIVAKERRQEEGNAAKRRYEVISKAYVEGYMRGEGMREIERREAEMMDLRFV